MACGEFSDYDVANVSFSRAPAKEAISKVMSGMPFQVFFNGQSDKVVSAEGVTGSLDKVLESLTAQLGVTYKKDRCVVTFSPKIDTSLVINADDLLSEKLSAWAKKYGQTLVWEAGNYRASAPISIDKGFNDTVDAVVGALKVGGISLDVKRYENNVIRMTEVK